MGNGWRTWRAPDEGDYQPSKRQAARLNRTNAQLLMASEIFHPGAAKRSWFNLAYEEDDQSANAYIYDDIGMYGIKAKDFIEEVNTVKANKLNVFINSYGGEIDEGVSIYNFLNRFNGEVTIRVDGMAASIASIIAMAGDKVIMPKASLMFIHNPWTMTAGDAATLQKEAQDLEKRKAALMAIYAEKTGLPSEVISQMMDEETLLSAEEAVAMKFADAMEEPMEKAMAYNAAMQNRIVKAMAKKLKHEDKAMVEEVKPQDIVDVVAENITPESKPELVSSEPVVLEEAQKQELKEEIKEEPKAEAVIDARAEFKNFVERFGQERAGRYFAAGLVFVDAEKAYLAEIEKENTELKAKLASVDLVKPVAARMDDSSDAPVTFTRAQIAKMSKEEYAKNKHLIYKAQAEGRIK